MRMKCRGAGLTALGLLAGGCADVGLAHVNTPLAETRMAPPAQVATVSAEPALDPGGPLPDIRLGGQRWVATGAFLHLPDRHVQPVGSAAGHLFYAFRWDQPPFDRLLASRPGGLWQEYREVVGADRVGGREPAAGAAAGEEAPAAGEAADSGRNAGH